MIIFEIKSKLEKKIRLTDVQLFHVLLHHPEMKNQESKIIDALRKPDLVLHDKPKDTFNYYKRFSNTPVGDKFLHVIVKHLNSEGFIITSYFADIIRKINRVVVYEKSSNEL